ncbi:hypothetical protein Q2319_26860, partial [Escherichia coli]|nr:hypothetical protein [Escherichia coli]
VKFGFFSRKGVIIFEREVCDVPISRAYWIGSGLCLGNVLQPVKATAKLEHTTIEALIKKPLAR